MVGGLVISTEKHLSVSHVSGIVGSLQGLLGKGSSISRASGNGWRDTKMNFHDIGCFPHKWG